MNVNEALSQLGSFGYYQFYVYSLSLIPQTITGLIFLSSVFISATPDYRCLIDECESSNQSLKNFPQFSSPLLKNSCNKFLIDKNYNKTEKNCLNNLSFNETNESCISFVFSRQQFESTIVTQWDLVCDNSWKIPYSQSVFMIGVLFGVLITGYLSDSYGRKSLFIYLPIITIISFMWTAFAPNFTVYTISTAISGFCIMGMSQTSYIIGIELIGAKYRVVCANMTNVMFALGSLVLCLIAYYIRDWRRLQLIISIPFCVTLFYYWLFPESIRWQVSNGQLTKALITIRRAAKWNGVSLKEHLFSENNYNLDSNDIKYGPIDLFKHPITRMWTLNLGFVWIANALIYFGLSFQAANLGSDLYLTFALLLAMDIPLILIASIMSQIFGRKKVLIFCLLFASISCLSTLFVTHLSILFTLMSVLGKSSAAASYAVINLYSVELYPTLLRSSGLGICLMISRFGGITAPFLIKLSIFNENFPLLFCAIIALIAALLVVLNLPETLGKELPENFDDIEKLNNNFIEEEKTKLLNRNNI